MTEIRHIVFDIGRVLLHYDPDLAFRELIPDADERKLFFAEICTHEWNVEQDRGRRWSDAEDELIAIHPHKADLIRAFRRNWHVMVPHAYEEAVAIMDGLIADGHDVTMLTNFAVDTFEEARERFAFLKRPRGVTVSGRVGLIKPDTAIYDLHAQTFALEPAATVFIDDSQANVEGARATGWQAIHFTQPRALREDLAKLGVGLT